VRAIAIDVLLAVSVLACWLGTIGFLRLRTALDRLHCVTFVNAASGATLLAAALVADGPTDRVAKVAVLAAAVLWAGAGLAHATGRALSLREKVK